MPNPPVDRGLRRWPETGLSAGSSSQPEADPAVEIVRRRRMRGRIACVAVLSAAAGAAGLGGCAAGGEPPDPWLSRVAAGQLERAQAEAGAGHREAARRLASEALLAARQTASLPVMAQAQLLLGRLDDDALRIGDALHLFTVVDDPAGRAQAGLAMAELAVRSGQVDLALERLAAASRDLDGVPAGRDERARTEARVDHLHATALRLAGRRAEAAAHERRAQLSLSLLRDEELQPLRISVCQSLGDDCAADRDFAQAVTHHARASDLSRRAGDAAGELAAAESLALDMLGLQRTADAYAHCVRALKLAVALEDRERTDALLARSRQLLTELGDAPGSARWRTLAAIAADA